MKPHEKVAERFAHALVDGRFDVARQLLTRSHGERISSRRLKETFESMIEYGGGPVAHVEVMHTLEDWPAKQEGDVGWTYVALSGYNHSEGVAVVVANEDSKLLIREIEWGRP